MIKGTKLEVSQNHMIKENITKFSINFAIEVLSYGNMINQICSFKFNTNRDNFEASLN